MYGAAVLIISALRLILRVFLIILIIRTILSWMPTVHNAFTNFVYCVTEPALAPVRKLVDRFCAGSSLPIDLSYIVLFAVIVLLLNIL